MGNFDFLTINLIVKKKTKPLFEVRTVTKSESNFLFRCLDVV